MTLREDPLVIATLHGPIEIHRIQGPREDRKLRIVLPSGLSVTVGEDRALSRNAWIKKLDGQITPKHELYAATPDHDGGVRLTPKDPPTPPQSHPVIRVVRRTAP